MRDTLLVEEGVTVTYARGANSVSLTAIAGQTHVELSDDLGSLSETDRYIDWLIKPTSLIISSVQVEPRKGDTITRTVDGDSHVYTVTEIPGAEAWRYIRRSLSGKAQGMMRIHTLLTSDG